MAQAHGHLAGSSPHIVSNPFKTTFDRLSHLLINLNVHEQSNTTDNTGIQKDIRALTGALKTDSSGSVRVDIPPEFVGATKFLNEEYGEAAGFLFKGIGNTTKVSTFILLFECLRHTWDSTLFEETYNRLEKTIGYQENNASFLLNATLSLLHGKRHEAALRLCDLMNLAIKENPSVNSPSAGPNFLNRMQTLLHKGDQLTDEQKKQVSEIYSDADIPTIKFGCLILLGSYQKAIEEFEAQADKFPTTIVDWPIVDLLPMADANKLRKAIGPGRKHFEDFKLDFEIKVSAI